jgi:hypothetical protein
MANSLLALADEDSRRTLVEEVGSDKGTLASRRQLLDNDVEERK